MARFPGAKWRPLSRNYSPVKTAKNCAILHSTGTNIAASQHAWFSMAAAGASSHFHVDFSGGIEQYVDTDHMSWANAAGNPRSITIETQGDGSGPWTQAQLGALVRLLVWIHKTHAVPLRQMLSSAPTETGIGWHRLGVRGNFPSTGILRGLNQRGGGQLWSGATGKTCPGDDRILQIPGLIGEVKAILNPEPVIVPASNVRPVKPSSKPKPQPKRYPDIPLIVDGIAGSYTKAAWRELMNAIGRRDADLDLAMQKWLAEHPKRYYRGLLDGQFGEMSRMALQDFLDDKKLYPYSRYLRDGKRGPAMVKAEQHYLNDQRRYIK